MLFRLLGVIDDSFLSSIQHWIVDLLMQTCIKLNSISTVESNFALKRKTKEIAHAKP